MSKILCYLGDAGEISGVKGLNVEVKTGQGEHRPDLTDGCTPKSQNVSSRLYSSFVESLVVLESIKHMPK